MSTTSVTHLQSATQIVTLGDVKILTDPWLTEGEYYGSWYHYPPFKADEIAKLDYDFIYVSHIHPDHLSPKTFEVLPRKVPVLIHNYASKFVKRKIESFGFEEVIELDHATPFEFGNGASITILAADNCNPELCAKFLGCGPVEKTFGSTQIDTLALFEHDGKLILNTNDCPIELAKTTIRANGIPEKNVDLLLVGYGGAGPYPQCFHFESEDEKLEAARKKEIQFLTKAVQYVELVKPKAFMPFAGTYILGSRLTERTQYRGVPSVADALDYISANSNADAKGFLLEQLDSWNVGSESIVVSDARPEMGLEEYVQSISDRGLEFDDDDWNDAELSELVQSAWERFNKRATEISFRSETPIVVQTTGITFKMAIGQEPEFVDADHADGLEKYLKLSLDHKLLHRLLRGPRYAHWNNAEIGSHLTYRRQPDVFERGLYHCLCFFHK